MLFEIKDISKSFGKDNTVIDRFSLAVNKGDMIALYSKVGGGKTTLCHMLTGLTKINGGYIRAGKRIVAKKGSAAGLHKLRQRAIGFVAADPVYMQDLTIYENFLLTDRGKGSNKAKQTKAREILKQVGLKGMGRYYPKELTSIEKLKASVARAILNNPVMLICDDPSEDLLYKNYDNDIEEFMKLLEMINQEMGITILVATSNPAICKKCKKTVAIHRGTDVREFNNNAYRPVSKGAAEAAASIDNYVVDLGFDDEQPKNAALVTKAPQAAAQTTAKTAPQAAAQATAKTAPQAAAQTTAQAAAQTTAQAAAQTTAKTAPQAAAQATAKTAPQAAAQTTAKTAPQAAAQATAKTAAQAAAQTTAKTAPQAAAQTTAKTAQTASKQVQAQSIDTSTEAGRAALEAMARVSAANKDKPAKEEELPEIDLSDLF